MLWKETAAQMPGAAVIGAIGEVTAGTKVTQHVSHQDDIAPLALSCMMGLLHNSQYLTVSLNSGHVFFPWGFWPCLPLLALVLVDVLLGVGRGLLFCPPGSTFLSSTHGPFGIFF